MKLKNYINESSLSKIWKYNEEYDCGALTAFRYARNCGNGEIYTKKENKQRNKKLLAQLKSLGYTVIRLQGVYPEGGKEKKEDSFFVVDILNKNVLKSDLKKLGNEYEQDSVLFIPKGSIKSENNAYLIGTNHCENNWLEFNKKEFFKKGRLGYDSKIYTSKVNGRPFIFECVCEEIKIQSGFDSIMIDRISKKPWQNI